MAIVLKRSAAVKKPQGATPTQPKTPPAADSSAAPKGRSRRRAAAKTPRSPSRVGKRAAVAWVEPEVVKRLGILAIHEDTTVQDLLAEAIGLLFADRGVHRPTRSR